MKLQKLIWIGIGPMLGALLATAFYKLLLAMKYVDANPDQDADSPLNLRSSVGSNDVCWTVSSLDRG